MAEIEAKHLQALITATRDLFSKVAGDVSAYLAKIEAVERAFRLEAAPALSIGSASEMRRLIISRGYAVEMQALLQAAESRAETMVSKPAAAVRSALASARALVVAKPEPEDSSRCKACNIAVDVDVVHSVLRCPVCGATQELLGAAFDDTQFYAASGQKSKTGAFKPSRHFQDWMTHIMATESELEISNDTGERTSDGGVVYSCEALIDSLRALARQKRIILQATTVYELRTMLSELGRADLNKNAALLLKKMTGVGPPEIPADMLARIEYLFSKATEIGDSMDRGVGRVNRNNYPYTIYRLIEYAVPESHQARRILFYIYLQNDATVARDDQDWERICAGLREIGEDIVYYPTDRRKQDLYNPARQ